MSGGKAAPAGELSDEQINDIDVKTLGHRHFARAIIAADRALRQPDAQAALAKQSELIVLLKQEAQIHAQEAKTANATIYEIYQCVTGATGEPGNWHGAEPVRAALSAKDALLDAKCTEIEALKAEKEALQDANLKLDNLCDATYVAQGADAYNHACERLEDWQEKRIKASKDPGCVGSLCGALEWLYLKLGESEAGFATLTTERDALRDVLINARETLHAANALKDGPIIDTIWMVHGPETLFDYIDSAMTKDTK